MPIMLNTLLAEAGIEPKKVRLIRHKDTSAKKGFSPYELWRDNRSQFELYQSTQSIKSRKKFLAPYWAVFVVNYEDKTMFVGLYSASYRGLLEKDTPMPHKDGIDKADSCDVFDLKLKDKMSEFIGKLFIDWGPAALAWVQHADRHNKKVSELQPFFREPDFPGYLNFIRPLSKLSRLPANWVAILKQSRGIYLLTCPQTREQYVGSASGEDGFWGRWQDYIKTGHGGNVKLISKEPSDYQVSILEVAGSSATLADILAMEGRWQAKLQSMEMGLNGNLASAAMQHLNKLY